MKRYISPLLLLLGVVILGASVFIRHYLVPYKVKQNVMKQSKIVEGNTRFKNWEVIPALLLQKIYFFNVTNPDEVVQGGKPILQEVGPYVYQQKRRKFDITFNENDTIFYREKMDYFFRSDLSQGSEDDWLNIVNIPFVSAAHKAVLAGGIQRSVILTSLLDFPEEKLYTNVTIRRLMFEGTYLPFIKELSELKGEQVLPNNTFGLYYGKNATDQGRFEIYSGEQYPDLFGNIVTWNGKESVDWWGEDEYCNKINGSDGGIFRPYVTKDRIFQMFIPGLCRVFKFSFESEENVLDIPVWKFSVKPDFFASGTENPDNACYCTDPGTNFANCPPSGAAQLLGCGKGAMVLSQPHFYQGSEIFYNQTVGLQPDKEKHEMALFIEAYTGVSARVKIRFQMNVDIRPNKQFRPLKKVSRMIHPLFWIDQSVLIPEESAVVLKGKLYGTMNKANTATSAGMIVGSVLIVVALLAFFMCSRDKRKEKSEGKIECVGYHVQGTLQKEKVMKADNGNDTDVERVVEEAVPFLTKTDFAEVDDHVPQISQVDSDALKKKGVGDVASDIKTAKSEELLVATTSTASISSETESNQHRDQDVTCNSDRSSEIQKASIDTPKSSTPVPSSNQVSVTPLTDMSKESDSRLSPFPSTTEYSSSLSLVLADDMKAIQETIAAMSSYENL